MKSILKSTLRKGSEFLPVTWRGRLNLAVNDFSETWRRQYPISTWGGPLRNGEGTAQVTCFGNLRIYRHWLSQIYDDKELIKEGELFSRNRVLTGEGMNPEDGLVLHPVNSLTEKQFQKAGWLIMPQYVNCTIDLRRPLEKILASRNIKNELRRIRKIGYTFEILKTDSALEEFYHEMLRPTEAARHGDLSDETDLEFLKEKYRTGYLLAAYLDSEWVGAYFVVIEDQETIRWRHVGWRNGNPETLTKGRIVSALLHELIIKSKDDGFSTLDLGACNPFADDGPLLSKLRWGAAINLPASLNNLGDIKDSETLIAAKFNLESEAGRSILHQTPVIVKSDSTVRVLSWNTSSRPEFKRQIENGLEWVNLAEQLPQENIETAPQ
jgi:hypothetical protein